MTMLEKLCRAACEAEGCSERYWPTYERAMRAALTVLEDPSDEMVRAGIDEINRFWTGPSPGGEPNTLYIVWRSDDERESAEPVDPSVYDANEPGEAAEMMNSTAIFTAMIRKAKEG